MVWCGFGAVLVRFWCNQKEHIPSALGYYATIPLTNEETFLSRATKFTATWPTSALTAERGSPFRDHNSDTTKVVDFYLRQTSCQRRFLRADLSALYPATFGVKKLRYSLGAPSIQ